MYEFSTEGGELWGLLLPAAVVNGALVFQLLVAGAGVDQDRTEDRPALRPL